MQEVWKSIKGYEGIYEISSLGNIRSLDRLEAWKGTERIRKGRPMKSRRRIRYLSIILTKNSEKFTAFIHRLIAEAFVPNPDNKPFVNHKDNNPLNNAIENLEWCTQKENIDHAVNQKRHCHGTTHGCHKLSENDVLYIRAQPQGGKKLAERFDLTYGTIKKIRRRETWKHVA